MRGLFTTLYVHIITWWHVDIASLYHRHLKCLRTCIKIVKLLYIYNVQLCKSKWQLLLISLVYPLLHITLLWFTHFLFKHKQPTNKNNINSSFLNENDWTFNEYHYFEHTNAIPDSTDNDINAATCLLKHI